MKKLIVLFLLLPTVALADVRIIGPLAVPANVNLSGAVETSDGRSTRPTYVVSSSGLVTTAAYNISIESSASTGFKLSSFCVGWTSATAAAGITVSVNRRSTASSAGTVMTAEGTGADSISKLDPTDVNFTGVGRRTATLGTIGATLFQAGLMVGEIGAGTADVPGTGPFCYNFAQMGDKPPTVSAGVANGLSITVTAPGAGGLAFGSISAVIVQE